MIAQDSDLYRQFGEMEQCRALSEAFFARVPGDPVLGAVYPRHLRCAIDGVTLFLAQLLGGPCEYARVRRGTLSLREAHQRFKIGPRERDAWLANMRAAIDDVKIPEPLHDSLQRFFERSSAFLSGIPAGAHDEDDISRRWARHLELERLVALVRTDDIRGAVVLAESPSMQDYFSHDCEAFLSFLLLLPESGLGYIADKLAAKPELLRQHLPGGRTLLHEFADRGKARAVRLALRFGADPNVKAGVKRVTALHNAARRGHLGVAEALLDACANLEAFDSKGETPLGRAVNCGKTAVAALLLARGADVRAIRGKRRTPRMTELLRGREQRQTD